MPKTMFSFKKDRYYVFYLKNINNLFKIETPTNYLLCLLTSNVILIFGSNTAITWEPTSTDFSSGPQSRASSVKCTVTPRLSVCSWLQHYQ